MIFSDTVPGVPRFWKELKQNIKFNFHEFLIQNKNLNMESVSRKKNFLDTSKSK